MIVATLIATDDYELDFWIQEFETLRSRSKDGAYTEVLDQLYKVREQAEGDRYFWDD